MTIGAPSRPAIKLKALLRFPASVMATAGLAVSRLNGIYTFVLDFLSLTPNGGIADPSKFLAVIYNTVTGNYEKVPLNAIPTSTTGDVRTPRGDANYSILNTDRYVALTAALTAPRTWTLPAANSVPGGTRITVRDEAGGVTATNYLGFALTGADTTNGTTTYRLTGAYGRVEFQSDGTSKWTVAVLETQDYGDATISAPKIGFGLIPQGRLTLVTGTPVMPASVGAGGNILYTPYVGDVIPLWNGSKFALIEFAEAGQSLTDATKSPSAAVASNVYDMFAWNDAGTFRVTRGPTWASGAGGSNTVRGTGAGSTELQRVNGLLVNKNAITNGPAAGFGTYVGTIMTDDSGATVTFSPSTAGSGGALATVGLWNAYNRRNVAAKVVDSGAAYTYSSATIRQARASTGNQINFVAGLAEDGMLACQAARITTVAAANANAQNGLGLDSTTAFLSTTFLLLASTAVSAIGAGSVSASIPPQLGRHYVASLEQSDGTNLNTLDVTSNNALSLSLQF